MTEKSQKWEYFDDYYRRAKVFGGWLVVHDSPVVHNLTAEGRGMEDGWDWRPSMVFIPDSNHEWLIGESYE